MNITSNQIEIESRIANLRVDYAPHESAYLQLKERIDMAVTHQYKGACVVSGDTGTGKSTLSKRACVDYPRVETEERSCIPLIYFQLTSKPTFKGILKGILAEYGVPTKLRDTEQSLFAMVKTQVAACNTRVLILDDSQHFVEEGRQVSIYAAADDMKVLIDLGLLVVFSGTPNLLSIFSINPQLRRRFSTRVHLQVAGRDEGSVMMLRNTVRDLVARSGSGLTVDHLDDLCWLRFHYATIGNIAYVNTLVAATAAEALRNGRQKITEKDFAAAFQAHIFYDATPITNPFSKKFEYRYLDRPGEPFEAMEVPA